MEAKIEFISDKNCFMKNLFDILKSPVHSEIFISGFLAESMLPEIINIIIENGHAGKCSILIPYIFNKARLKKIQAKEIYMHGGSIRVNSSLRSKLIVVDNNVFVASFSYKGKEDRDQKFVFDNCMFTDCQEISEKIRVSFNEKWKRAFPIVIEGVQEEIT
jgi:hypothetical protein